MGAERIFYPRPKDLSLDLEGAEIIVSPKGLGSTYPVMRLCMSYRPCCMRTLVELSVELLWELRSSHADFKP